MVYSVIGTKGFLGRHFTSYLQKRKKFVFGTHHKPTIEYKEFDLIHPYKELDFRGVKYALICGGNPSFDKCESEVESTFACNVEGPLLLGKKVMAKGILPIFFSTNYIFDGRQGIYEESSIPSPLNEYGRQKAILEKRVREELNNAPVIRLSKVYGSDKGDGTLFDEMAQAFVRGDPVKAAEDLWLAPIHVEDVVRESLAFIERGGRGIFHLSSQVEATRFEMANAMAARFGGIVIKIKADSLSGKRPLRAHLQSKINALSWQEGMQKVIQHYEKSRGDFSYTESSSAVCRD